MKCMERNKETFWYANYAGKEEILDGGKRTGQFRVKYSDPIMAKASISPARGGLNEELFGVNAVYDRTIITDDTEIDISGTSVLWIENAPGEPWDYQVEEIARSKNIVAVAIKRVSVQ